MEQQWYRGSFYNRESTPISSQTLRRGAQPIWNVQRRFRLALLMRTHAWKSFVEPGDPDTEPAATEAVLFLQGVCLPVSHQLCAAQRVLRKKETQAHDIGVFATKR